MNLYQSKNENTLNSLKEKPLRIKVRNISGDESVSLV